MVKKVCKIIFWLSFLYYVFWLIMAIKGAITGVNSCLLISICKESKLVYGKRAFEDVIGLGILYTILCFFIIPIYEILYIVISILIKVRNKYKKEG